MEVKCHLNPVLRARGGAGRPWGTGMCHHHPQAFLKLAVSLKENSRMNLDGRGTE